MSPVARASFADLLRQHRLAAGLTQETLAERAGLSVTGIQRLERGPGHPYRDTVQRLATALGLLPQDQVAFRAAAQPVPRRRRDDSGGQLPDKADLPDGLTSFIGREREVADISTLLASVRLLTLTGVGGCGKTRLAVEVARAVGEAYPDGVCFVELVTTVDGTLVPQAVASAFGVRETRAQPLLATLTSVLKERQILLVLDNCEHLIEACAHLAGTLLRACRRLHILATSREALGITGEVTRRVPSLSMPPLDALLSAEHLTEFEAVQLFVERANAVRSDFVLTDRNAAAIARVCHRVDGIPLALELAAARIRTLGVSQILERLDRSIGLLVGGRTAPTRQQTMRATLDWSYGLLGHAEQTLFRRLAVFAGGFTLEAVETVCTGDSLARAETLDVMTGLVDKSLVVSDTDSDEARYRLLEIVRQYALERLERVNETTLVRIRHRDWYLDLAERALPELTRADQRIWYARLTADFDNLRLALEWNRVDPDGAEPELRLAAALGRYWDIHGPRREGQKWIESALARSASAPTPARASALLWAATFAGFDDEMARSRAMLEEGVAVARQVGDSQLLTNALRHLGACLHLAGDSAGLARLEEALATSRAAGNLREVAYSLCYIGRILEDAGDLVSAERLYSEGLAAGRSSGDALPVSQLLLNLGRMAAARGEYARAAAMMKESLDRSELRRSGHGERGMALLHLASLSRSLGQDVAARARCLESLELARNCGDRLMMSAGLLVMAGLEEAVGRFVQAARLFGAEAAGRPREGGMSRVAYPSPTDPARYAEDLASARRALGNDAFAVAWAQGQAMTLEEAASMVLTDNTPVGTRT